MLQIKIKVGELSFLTVRVGLKIELFGMLNAYDLAIDILI